MVMRTMTCHRCEQTVVGGNRRKLCADCRWDSWQGQKTAVKRRREQAKAANQWKKAKAR